MTMNVPGASTTSATYVLDPAAESLTADSVMAYCSSRLSAANDLIQSRFAEQQKKNAALKETGNLLNVVSRWNGMTDGSKLGPGTEHHESHKHLAFSLYEVRNSATDPDVRARAEAAFKTVTGTAMPPPGGLADKDKVAFDLSKVKGMTPEQWQATMVGSLKTHQDGLSKDSEMSMIQMQSIISQRQLAVQLTTQIMAALAEAMKGIVANVRA